MKRIKKVKYEIKSNRRLSINIKEKSSGFTLIELIAVIAIIMILSGVLFPKVLGYVQEAKKLKVVDQCRKIVMATESYNLRYIPLEKNQSVSSIINKDGIKKYINEEEFKNITYYGRGEIENYWDKYKSAKVGLYEDIVTEKMVNYLQPQENGAKTDVRYLEIKNEKVDKGEEILKSIVKDDILEIRDNEEKQD